MAKQSNSSHALVGNNFSENDIFGTTLVNDLITKSVATYLKISRKSGDYGNRGRNNFSNIDDSIWMV